jgi:hypothetical protein
MVELGGRVWRVQERWQSQELIQQHREIETSRGEDRKRIG